MKKYSYEGPRQEKEGVLDEGKSQVFENKAESAENKESRDAQPLVLVSENDAYINQRMKEQPKSLDDVKLKVITDEQIRFHRLKLPKEFEAHGKEFGFRWLNKRKQAIDYALDVVGWTLVNKLYFSNVPDYLFTANGSVERGDAILAFMPMKQVLEIRERPGKLSRERVRNLPMEKWRTGNPDVYYKPDLGEEKEGEVLVGGVQPDLEVENQNK